MGTNGNNAGGDDFKARLEAACMAQQQPKSVALIVLQADGNFGLQLLPGASVSAKQLAWALCMLASGVVNAIPDSPLVKPLIDG